MYKTCLFCNGDLGGNEVVEAFPVGRRLAFDPAKGRLWVVCRRCERWNLTPLEERWEAIEACERAFRGTKLRVSTGEIGLARLREGLELVRIGAPQRPEMAAWRYGDQFGRRQRRRWTKVAIVGAAAAGYVVAGPGMGILSMSLWPAIIAANVYSEFTNRRARTRIHDQAGRLLPITRPQAEQAELRWSRASRRWVLDVPLIGALSGDAARNALQQLLPIVNAKGARASAVSDAVVVLDRVSSADDLFGKTARHHVNSPRDGATLGNLQTHVRLALEMAAHEESERRALEGELHILAAAWREAEEIAGIADNMLLPTSVDADLERLKRQRDADP